jgi:hypothetical protein
MNEPICQQIARRNSTIVDAKYAVIKIDDINLQVGLVQSVENELKFNVIGNYHVFDRDMSINAGEIRHL